MVSKKTDIKIGQICWTTGGHVMDFLNGRLVKVTKVSKNGSVEVRLLNPTAQDVIALGKDCSFGYSNSFWLFTSPEDWRDWMEGGPDSVTQPVEQKKELTCHSCSSKITSKMKFCAECGAKL